MREADARNESLLVARVDVVATVEKTNFEKEFAIGIGQREDTFDFQVNIERMASFAIEGGQETGVALAVDQLQR